MVLVNPVALPQLGASISPRRRRLRLNLDHEYAVCQSTADAVSVVLLTLSCGFRVMQGQVVVSRLFAQIAQPASERARTTLFSHPKPSRTPSGADFFRGLVVLCRVVYARRGAWRVDPSVSQLTQSDCISPPRRGVAHLPNVPSFCLP